MRRSSPRPWCAYACRLSRGLAERQGLGAHANGYTPFGYDLTPYLSASGDNLLAVRVRNLGQKQPRARRGDVSFVVVELLDAQGRPVSDLARAVRLTLSGPAELIGWISE